MIFKYLLVILICALSGCANTGARFNPAIIETAPDDKALVYFYRSWKYVLGGVSAPIVTNSMDIGSIDNGAYLKRILAPGAYKIHSDTNAIDRVANFVFKPGKTYFMKTYVDVGLWVSSIRFRLVHKQKAIKEMNETNIQIENYIGDTEQ